MHPEFRGRNLRSALRAEPFPAAHSQSVLLPSKALPVPVTRVGVEIGGFWPAVVSLLEGKRCWGGRRWEEAAPGDGRASAGTDKPGSAAKPCGCSRRGLRCSEAAGLFGGSPWATQTLGTGASNPEKQLHEHRSFSSQLARRQTFAGAVLGLWGHPEGFPGAL